VGQEARGVPAKKLPCASELLCRDHCRARSLSEKEPVYQSIVAVSRVKGDNDSSLLLSLIVTQTCGDH
jgi:hypothetical protein